eukprot:5351734-Prymnesium_polylepis.1
MSDARLAVWRPDQVGEDGHLALSRTVLCAAGWSSGQLWSGDAKNHLGHAADFNKKYWNCPPRFANLWDGTPHFELPKAISSRLRLKMGVAS